MNRAALLVPVALLACRHHDDDRDRAEREEATGDRDNDPEAAEEREAARPVYWRAQIAIVGNGRVADPTGAFDCHRDERGTSGTCGPKLVTFTELRPPLLTATPAPDWAFAGWQPVVRGRDGVVHERKLPPPDGPRYLNGFGYVDTGELETITVVFKPARNAPAM